MKLTPSLKERIDSYFSSISPEELYKKAVTIYRFEEVYDLPLPSNTIELNYSLKLKGNSGTWDSFVKGEEIYPIAA